METLVINDATARTNALLSKQVDVINRVDFKIVDALAKAPGTQVKRSSGGQHYVLPRLWSYNAGAAHGNMGFATFNYWLKPVAFARAG